MSSLNQFETYQTAKNTVDSNFESVEFAQKKSKVFSQFIDYEKAQQTDIIRNNLLMKQLALA